MLGIIGSMAKARMVPPAGPLLVQTPPPLATSPVGCGAGVGGFSSVGGGASVGGRGVAVRARVDRGFDSGVKVAVASVMPLADRVEVASGEGLQDTDIITRRDRKMERHVFMIGNLLGVSVSVTRYSRPAR
jgi:hypothetical protein